MAGRLCVRNRIYEHVFDHRWVVTHMPDAELRRQKRAFRQGLAMAGALSGAVLAVVALLAAFAMKKARLCCL